MSEGLHFAKTTAYALFVPANELAGTQSAMLQSHSFQRPHSGSPPLPIGKFLSPWSRSGAKRVFDCVCVVCMLPLLVPISLAIALAVRLTSSGPVLFLQKRTGRHGRHFTILKFRTMIHASQITHCPISTSRNQLFTRVGPFLRRWKLDELPQLLNVFAGHMSLVGPRPKLPEHAIADLQCRAGITGAATIAFAREEAVLASLPEQQLVTFYHSVALPAKRRLDAEYMVQATFLSDLRLIVNSILRRWDSSFMEGLLNTWASEQENSLLFCRIADSGNLFQQMPILPDMDQPVSSQSGILRMPDPAADESRIEKEFVRHNEVHDNKVSQHPCHSHDLCPVCNLNN